MPEATQDASSAAAVAVAVEAPAPTPLPTEPPMPVETAKELRKKIEGLDHNLFNIHNRLVQTEKQIFDLERSYLEETRLYGNVLQGWDSYLDSKAKTLPGTSGKAARAARGTVRARATAATMRGKLDGDAAGGSSGSSNEETSEGGAVKRARGVALQERLFSLGSVTSPGPKQQVAVLPGKVDGKGKGGGGVKQADAGAGGGAGANKGSGSKPGKDSKKGQKAGKGSGGNGGDAGGVGGGTTGSSKTGNKSGGSKKSEKDKKRKR